MAAHVPQRDERVKHPLLSMLAFLLTASEEYGPSVTWLNCYAINVKARGQTSLNSNIANGGTQDGGALSKTTHMPWSSPNANGFQVDRVAISRVRSDPAHCGGITSLILTTKLN